jgi:hypothetical protein
MKKTSVFLATLSIIGTVALGGSVPPALPTSVSHSLAGKGTAYKWNEAAKSYLLSDALELQWDLERGCFAFYQYNYLSVNDWSEYSYCDHFESKFDSQQGVCLNKRIPKDQQISIKDHLNEWWSGYNQHRGDIFTDPIWGRGTYSLFRHKDDDKSEMYVNVFDGKVYFLSMRDENGLSHVVYFSRGLSNEAKAPAEFGLRKSKCDSENTFGHEVPAFVKKSKANFCRTYFTNLATTGQP